jgi:hypothetical protein
MSRTRAPKWCRGCRYVSCEGGCDYLLRTGHSRGCPPGEGCTVRDTGGRDRVSCGLPPLRTDRDEYRRTAASVALEHDETALRLYAAGASDPAIARATGWGVATVRNWRRRTGRPANYGRKEHGNEGNEPQGGSG